MAARDIHAVPEANGESEIDTEGPPPPRESGIRPVASVDMPAPPDMPTVPPPRMRAARTSTGLVAPRRSNGPFVDEVLYRLSVGDVTGAERASERLDELVPLVVAPHAVVGDPPLRLAEAWILALVDGKQTCADVLASSPFARDDSLASLCELVDRGLVVLG